MPKRSTLKLTKRIVERLKTEGKDAIYWDRDVAGFGVRVHTTGRKLYIVQSRGAGRPEAGDPGTGRRRPDRQASARGRRCHRPDQTGRGAVPPGAGA